jgi:hypothetical protein
MRVKIRQQLFIAFIDIAIVLFDHNPVVVTFVTRQ